MAVIKRVAYLALQQMVTTMTGGLVGKAGFDCLGTLREHFKDQSSRLTAAMQTANQRSWLALELALGGPSWWERCAATLVSGEEKAFADRVRQFLQANELPDQGQAFAQTCLQELRSARAAGLLRDDSFAVEQLDTNAAVLARWLQPESRAEAEELAVQELAEELRQAGHSNLARLVTLRVSGGVPLLVASVRFFFRLEIEANHELFQGLTFARLENLTEAQQAGFAALQDAMADQGDRLEQMLHQVAVAVVQTRDAVLDLQSEIQGQRDEVRALGVAVLQMLQHHHLQERELQPRDSLAISDPGERQLVKQLLARYRALPQDRRQQLPALLNGVGKLQVGTGAFVPALHDFQEVAGLAADAAAQAEAHYHAHRAALEQAAWADALQHLRQAIERDARRFAPFPVERYVPQRILGASGIGATFLCHSVSRDCPVVVKVIFPEDLDRAIEPILAEAQILRHMNHGGIVSIAAGGYMDAARHLRPFLVMDYFDGLPLTEHVQKYGRLTLDELAIVARQTAEALHAAHEKNILHRAVKPSNLLLRKEDSGALTLKLIDFGLALKPRGPSAAMPDPGTTPASLFGSSLAGMRDYAAPEQSGRLHNITPGPAMDVYGFGRSCCHALFQTARPLPKDWLGLPALWKKLLQQCLQEQPENRLPNFAEILRQLDEHRPATAPPVAGETAAAKAEDNTGKKRRRLWPF